MNINETEIVSLPSGFKAPMSVHMHDNYYCDFTESQLLSFNNYINAGSYFPRIAQFVLVLIAIMNEKTSGKEILICSIAGGIVFTLIWFWGKLYKIPALGFMSCLIGGNVFRYFLHFIAIVVISLFVLKDWKVILFCAIGGIISSIIRPLLFGRLLSVKYVDDVVRYVSRFKYKF